MFTVMMGICDTSAKSISACGVSSVSVSSPMMMPEAASIPYLFTVWIASRIGMRMFCPFFIALSAFGSGVSMPKKQLLKPAFRIFSRMRVCPAMLSVASQARRT